MTEIAPPFEDNGEGYPTNESVLAALGMFKLEQLAQLPASFRDPEGVTHEGTIVDLVEHCRIEHLVRGWPKGFVAHVVGAASQATKGNPEN